MKLTGGHGSLMENRVFEEIFEQNAVSTIKILQTASDSGVGICTITTSVYGDCPGITQPPSVIGALNSALTQGHVITIPEDPITVSLWSGTGYIDMDPATGAAGFRAMGTTATRAWIPTSSRGSGAGHTCVATSTRLEESETKPPNK